MSELVRPGRVEASVAVPEGVLLTRVVVGQGIHLVESVTGLGRVTVKMDIHGDGVLMDKLVYPSLMVLRFTP